MLLLLLGAAATAADTATGGHHGKPLGGIARNSTVLGEPPSQVADLDLCGGEERLFQAAKKTTELGAGSAAGRGRGKPLSLATQNTQGLCRRPQD